MSGHLKFCLDIQALQSESADRGVGRYSRGLAEAVIQSGRENVHVIINTALAERGEAARAWARERLPDSHILNFAGPSGIMGLYPDDGRKWQGASALYDAFLSYHNVNGLHTSAPFDGMGDDTVIGDPRQDTAAGVFRMATLYDLIPFQEPDHYLADPRYKQWYNTRLDILRRYDLLLTISDYTRKIAIDFGGIDPDRVVTISADTIGPFTPVKLSPEYAMVLMARYGISRPFVMHTGILEARKNVKALVRAFAALPGNVIEGHQLVFVARTTELQRNEILRTAVQLGLSPETLVFPGFVEDDDLAGLYSLTRALVMPSTSEGFGLPLLEAMRCGAPVLGANATSIPQVVGAKAYLFDPHDPKDLAGKLYPLLTDADAIAKARAHSSKQQRCFSWERSANLMMDAWESACIKRGKVSSFTPPIRYHFVANPGDVASVRERNAMEARLHTRSAGKDNQQALTLPILAIGDMALSPEQEKFLQRPFMLLADAENEDALLCSSDVKYLCEGWSRIKALDKGVPFVTPAQLSSLPNCILAANAEPWTQGKGEGFPEAGERFYTALSAFMRNVPSGLSHEIAAELAWRIPLNLMPVPSRAVLYVDVSELVHRDSRTGIQRVVRNVLMHLLSVHRDQRIEPVYRDGAYYRHARAFTANFLGVPKLGLPDDYVTFGPNDTFLGLDLDALIPFEALRHLKQAQLGGTRLVWVVYDILAVAHPEWFDAGMAGAIRQWVGHITCTADRLICISRAVADTVMDFVEASPPSRLMPLDVCWWHLGSDLDGSPPSSGITKTDEERLNLIPRTMPVFITVGTIEPRKGVAKLLDGAEAFWSGGGQACFILVGKAGWNMEALHSRIRSHPELGQRLFWFEGASDVILNKLYAISDAAVMPSEGEGFGLPLVEAAYHGKPIIARDLMVFREIAGPHASYFLGHSPEMFAEELTDWIKAYGASQHPRPDFGLQTWLESSNVLYGTVGTGAVYRTWQPFESRLTPENEVSFLQQR